MKFLYELKNLENYEPKVTRIRKVFPYHAGYHAEGKVLGLSWNAPFTVEFNDSGFRSQMKKRLSSGFWIEGGFVVNSNKSEGCTVHQYENFTLPGWLLPMKPFLQIYLQRLLQQELKQVKRGVETSSQI